jgi:hypothetical protein
MPWNVTSDELSKIFSVHVADILLQPGDPLSSHSASKDFSMSEAWIKNCSDQRSAQTFVKKYAKIKIREFEINCDVVKEPFIVSELCRELENGICKFASDRCNYKHIMCDEPDECDNERCWYGHSKKRSIKSIRRPMEGTNKRTHNQLIPSGFSSL